MPTFVLIWCFKALNLRDATAQISSALVCSPRLAYYEVSHRTQHRAKSAAAILSAMAYLVDVCDQIKQTGKNFSLPKLQGIISCQQQSVHFPSR